jgi:transcriptional regulator with XRE-family HTH domain
MFGEFIKEKRLAKSLSLREFCRQLGEDASNWSKVERGVMTPPRDIEKLTRIAEILGILKRTPEWDKLNDLATVDNGKIPDYIMSDKEVLQALPIFFRTIGSEKPTLEEIRKLIDGIKKGG